MAITYEDTMIIEQCCSCGVTFGMTRDFYRRRRDDGKYFYCPSGHSQHYTDTTVMRLERRVKTLEQQEYDLRESLRSEKRRSAAARGQVTKARNRAKAGVCLFCKRTFQNVVRHMQSQHADEHVEEDTP